MGQGAWHVLQANVPPSLVRAFEVSRPPLCLTRYLSYHTEQCQMVGASMNLQNACPQQSSNQNCQVTCQDPSQSNQCVTLQSQLIDGSPCGQSLFVSNVTCLTFYCATQVMEGFAQVVTVKLGAHLIPPR